MRKSVAWAKMGLRGFHQPVSSKFTSSTKQVKTLVQFVVLFSFESKGKHADSIQSTNSVWNKSPNWWVDGIIWIKIAIKLNVTLFKGFRIINQFKLMRLFLFGWLLFHINSECPLPAPAPHTLSFHCHRITGDLPNLSFTFSVLAIKPERFGSHPEPHTEATSRGGPHAYRGWDLHNS